jgi:hypothetical protein
MAPYANELWRFCFISEEEQPGLDAQRPQEQSGKRRPDDHGNGYLRAREGVRAKTAFRPAQL